jgi:phosphotransferase system enzyme I (PtsI)
MRTLRGIAASPGYAVGPVHRIVKRPPELPSRTVTAEQVEAEVDRFRAAVGQARAEIRVLMEKLERELGPAEARILGSHLLILEDELTWDRTIARIREERLGAEQAFSRACADIAVQLRDTDAVFRERIVDLRDVEERVLRALTGEVSSRVAPPPEPSIVAAPNLTPSDTAALGRRNVLAFLMDEGSQTSHVAILARSLGVPAVVGLGDVVAGLTDGVLAAVDGEAGEVVLDPDPEVVERCRRRGCEQQRVDLRLAGLRDAPAVTPDGRRVQLMANVELPEEADEALARGAEGIGLLRTEYLYFRHQDIPDEEEQVEAYADVLRRMDGRPVVMRTLDVGGDKVSRYLGAKREYNPFLGWRGIRFCLANRTLFKTQIRAMYRAAAQGPARLMFPMVTGLEELRAARELCAECLDELAREGRPHASDTPVGIMIETPAAAVIADLLARECDFFSLGTNDLIQYTLAMDRTNSRVAYLYQPLHPAVLRTLRAVVQAAAAAGIPAGLCGEMGAETRYAEVLLGLGFDEISLHGAALPKIKQVIRWTPYTEARALVAELADLGTAAEAAAHLAAYIERKKRLRHYGEDQP